eukprot:PhF_6_TR15422/c0_g1_i1/m.23916
MPPRRKQTYFALERFIWSAFPFLILLSFGISIFALIALPAWFAPSSTSGIAGVLQLSEDEAQAFSPILRYDIDGDNALSLEEFSNFVASQMKSHNTMPHWFLFNLHTVTRFLQLDGDRDNRLSMPEIAKNKDALPGLSLYEFPRWVAGMLIGLQPPPIDVNFLK